MRAAPACLAILLLAGCSAAPAGDDAAGPSASVTATGTDAPAPPAALVSLATVPVAWEGRTKEGAWVCSDQDGATQCPAGQQVLPDGEHVTRIPFAGNLTGLDVNMTWQADATQAGLVLAAYANTTAGFTLLGHVRGTSPLPLVLDAAAVAGVLANDAVVLMVWPAGRTPTQPSVFLDATRQAFTVEGNLLTIAG